MHETMVAQSLLATISDESAKQNAKPISAKISCGTLNAINNEVLCFAFEAIAKGTMCEGIKLEVEHKPIRGRCKNCKENFDVALPEPRCPKCDSGEFDLLPDAPLMLEEIEFETE
ncbi:MAG: hydrogenase maturation nickel metallochaperone HypA [Planctomycetota bacterium]|nr:MAG: hydrogenase maturation nickel metallochaperone HypA [Planctomycetota bacterium]